MGAAKRRGTFEDRKIQALTKDEEFDAYMELGVKNLDRYKDELYRNIQADKR